MLSCTCSLPEVKHDDKVSSVAILLEGNMDLDKVRGNVCTFCFCVRVLYWMLECVLCVCQCV